MEAQLFNYWNYVAPAYQTPVYDLPDVADVPSLSGSPVSVMNDQFPAPAPQPYLPIIADEQATFGAYPMSISPSEFGSDRGSPQCTPHPAPPVDAAGFTPVHSSPSAERTNATSGRRRAQNRAAQRAFRERKEKHARELEAQLSVMNEKYNKLEASHSELNIAYQKLRKTVELLTQDNDVDAEGEDEIGQLMPRRTASTEGQTLRKLLEILHGEFKASTPVKMEEA